MKLGMTIYSAAQYCETGKMSVEEFINYSAKLGVEAVDLGYFWKDEEKELKMVPGWLKKAGLKLGGYIVGNDFAQKDNNVLKEEIKKVKHALDRANQLGADKLRVFIGDVKDGVTSYKEIKPVIVEAFKDICSYGKNKKVKVTLENHGRLCGKVDQLLDFIGAVGSDNLKLNIDTGNFMIVDEDPVKSIAKLFKLAVHVHIKDYKRSDGNLVSPVIGEGDVDLTGCFRELKKNNYKGYLSIEYEAAEDFKSGIEKSIKNIREALSRI